MQLCKTFIEIIYTYIYIYTCVCVYVNVIFYRSVCKRF